MKTQKISPASIENLRSGKMGDSITQGLYIERLASGKLAWKYRRRLRDSTKVLAKSLGLYPAMTIGDARDAAQALNLTIDAKQDPRVEEAKAKAAMMTIKDLHGLYMKSAALGKGRKKAPNARTLADKQAVFDLDMKPIHDSEAGSVTIEDLARLVEKKSETAPVRANRLLSEMGTFFKWTRSVASPVRLSLNPAEDLSVLKMPESVRTRFFDSEEIKLFMQALAPERRLIKRAMMLFLLSGVRYHTLLEAPSSEISGDVWLVRPERGNVKNDKVFAIQLGPWGRHLLATNDQYIIESSRIEGGQKWGWYKVRDRIHARMEELAGTTIAPWTFHDLRRTLTSTIGSDEFGVSLLTQELMVGHTVRLPEASGARKHYDHNKYMTEKAAGWLAWERHLIKLAKEAGVADALEVRT